jgi:hypothetical protein
MKAAILTGGHHYHVTGFHQLFRDLPGIDAYVQHMADFVACSPEIRREYDVLVFYTQFQDDFIIPGLPPGSRDTVRSVVESVGTTNQGIVILHHGLLSFPGWDIWNDIVGMPDRSLSEYSHDESIPYHIMDSDHPVCAGLTDWTLTDETYQMAAAAGDNHILITTDHPDSMKTLAWTRHYKLSRVFCLQAGHDPKTWNDMNFRALLSQGMHWCASS